MRNNVPYYELGDNVILDLGRCGHDFYQKLNEIVAGVQNYHQEFTWAVKLIYETTINDLIRILHLHPSEVVERLKYFPRSDSLTDVWSFIEHESYDEVAIVCQEYGLKIYLHLKFQFQEIPNDVCYIPIQLGIDYVVVSQARKLSSYTNGD